MTDEKAPHGYVAQDLPVQTLPDEETPKLAVDLLRGYLALAEQPASEARIAQIALAATIALYGLLDLQKELPATLRSIADRLEAKGRVP